jgi:PAS domain S-box-containing protein
MDTAAYHEGASALPDVGNGLSVRATPALLVAVLDVAVTPVLVMGMDRRIAWANRAMLALTGYDFDELVGHPIDLLIPSGDNVDNATLYGELTAQVRGGGVWSGRATSRLKDGQLHQHEMTVTPVRTGGALTHAIVVSHDSAERRQSQARLLLTDRMVSIGTLAAGVAHEINNPLAFLLTNLNFAADKLAALEHGEAAGSSGPRLAPQGAPGKEGGSAASMGLAPQGAPDKEGGFAASVGLADVRAAVVEAQVGAERVRDLVRDLRTFSRGDDGARAPVNVERVLESSIKMAWNEIRHRARLVRQYGGVPQVAAEAARLGQVFLNLILNAVQAIPEGDVQRNEIRVTTRVDAEGRVVAEVRDSGEGMPAAVQQRLFEPFFTTKPVGVGTGLGLYICHHIVTDFGGAIQVESAPGEGSLFRITLPLAPPQPTAASLVAGSGPARQRARVLVVDDEPMIGATLARVLSVHEVIAIRSAREALARIGGGERFDVILCDLMMPEMSGMDLHAALSGSAPEAAGRMVFLTGGIFTPAARAFAESIPNPIVEKPFDAGALRALVARVVAGAS